ncbi:Protein FAM179B, partial [Stegodyphus mimosarum]
MGAARILTSAKDVTERLIPTTAQFLMDGMPLTRYYGRRIYHLLMQHPAFDKLLLRHVQPSTLRNINSILDSVRKKGPGEMPKEGVSAKTLKNETYRSALLNRTM